jgi:Glutathione S-transferase, C-terminal domain
VNSKSGGYNDSSARVVAFLGTDRYQSIRHEGGHLSATCGAAVESYPVLLAQPPDFVKAVVDTLMGELRGHGMGRHTADEVEHIGKIDLTTLSDFLGDKPYLLGNHPTSYDATTYSFVAQVVQPEYDSRMKKFAKTLPNLTGYWERLTSILYNV